MPLPKNPLSDFEIVNVSSSMDAQTLTVDVYITPKVSIQQIKLDVSISPTGAEFRVPFKPHKQKPRPVFIHSTQDLLKVYGLPPMYSISVTTA